MQHSEPSTHSSAVATLALHLPFLGPSRIARQCREFKDFHNSAVSDRQKHTETVASCLPNVTSRHDHQETMCDFGVTTSNEFLTRSNDNQQRVSHSFRRASRSFQIRNPRSRSTEDRQPPCSASTATRSRGKAALRHHVCRVSALCPARNFRSRSNQTMGCAHAWMSGRAYESSLSMSRLVYKLKNNKCSAVAMWMVKHKRSS